MIQPPTSSNYPHFKKNLYSYPSYIKFNRGIILFFAIQNIQSKIVDIITVQLLKRNIFTFFDRLLFFKSNINEYLVKNLTYFDPLNSD